MTAKKKTKTNKQDVWKKQEVETSILDAFKEFENNRPKGGNLFELLNIVFKKLKILDLPPESRHLKPNSDLSNLEELKDESESKTRV
jgi:hypothetical protein